MVLSFLLAEELLEDNVANGVAHGYLDSKADGYVEEVSGKENLVLIFLT